MADITLANLMAQAREQVQKVADDPEGRLLLRERFYQKYGFEDHSRSHGFEKGMGFGVSELDFLRWEIHRGVLNPLDDPSRPGSPWWRAVNADFLLAGCLASLIAESGSSFDSIPLDARQWLRYFEDPSPASWYRAHNCSIGLAYLRHRELARDREQKSEQLFMNIVLYRVLFAQALVGGATLFGALGRMLSDPRLPAVHILVHLPDFYPRNYPLSPEDVRDILHQAHNLEDETAAVLDDLMILPELDRLYQETGKWNEVPDLNRLQRNCLPIYPEFNESSGSWGSPFDRLIRYVKSILDFFRGRH